MRKCLIPMLGILLFALPAQATFDFEWHIVDQVQTGPDFGYIEYEATLTNTGDETDTYAVHKDETLPGIYGASICVGDLCYAPFVNDVVSDPVLPGETIDVRVDIILGQEPGNAFVTLTVESQGDNGLSETADFTGIHEECDLLLVDDAAKGESLAQTLLNNMPAGKTLGVWPLRDQEPNLTDMQAFPATLWFTGNTLPGLTYTDRQLIDAYLDSGHGMMISGRDIAESVYAAGAGAWFESALGLEFLGDGSSSDVNGEGGDALGDGLSFSLDGSQGDPDILDVVTGDPVSVSFRYGSPNAGAIAGITRSGARDLIYLAFGAEAAGGGALSDILERACEILIPTGDFAFHWELTERVQIGGDFGYLEYFALLTNTGSSTDTYTVHKDEMFAGPIYGASICVGELCYAPFINDVVTDPVAPGASIEVRVDIIMGDEPGNAYVTLDVASVGDVSVAQSRDFTAIHTDCDLLLVDDAAKSENLWLDIPAALGGSKTMGVWPRRDQLPELSDLHEFSAALWLTGNTLPGLEEVDRNLVASYLAGGNAMLISGQDIAQDLSLAGQDAWLETVLGIEYLGSGASTNIVEESGDHLGTGLAIALDGSQTDPDHIAPTDGGIYSSSFRYTSGPGTGEVAGITYGDPSRHIFLGFGLEGTGSDLGTLLERSCEILLPTGVEPDQVPSSLALKGNYPNPFNPKTTFSFLAPKAGDAKIEVLDIQGRRVNTLAVKVQAGANEIPFLAQDNRGHALPSGLYLYRVRLGEEIVAGKMTLLK